MNRRHPLLTVDEAADLLGSTAVALMDSAPLERIPGLLCPQGGLHDLDAVARDAVRAYRRALDHVRAVGLGWIVDDQVDGALSYAAVEALALEARAA